MSTVNWAKLYEQGRCKAIGINFSPEELKARYEYKIPVEHIRNGILTPEQYEITKNEKFDTQADVLAKAQKVNPNVTSAASKAELEKVIKEGGEETQASVLTEESDIAVIKEAYAKKLNKKPFHGWDKAELLKRINA